MSRIPPALSYLTIYNTTLRPNEPIDPDDEDAEEQAQILFYTSRERAVSRDRMLRQIGLAKALVNFSQSFGANHPYNTIHAHTRRMVMVSPEPDFWLHICIDLAKVERPSDPKSKPTSSKAPDKAKPQSTLYDYEDGSILDGALRDHLMKGYNKFKLTHGSMSSVLATLGQQALELQLERFWTVWAWSWDLEERASFAEDCGPYLHPYFNPLISILDDFSINLSQHATPIVLSRAYMVPSTKYTVHRHPLALALHLSSMIPPPAIPSSSSETVDTLAASFDTIRGRHLAEKSSGTSSRTKSPDGNGKFLGIPTNVDFGMDVTKWQWPGYLTFGKKNLLKPPIPEQVRVISPPATQDGVVDEVADNSADQNDASASSVKPAETQVEAEVNADDLQDAIESDSISMGSRRNELSDRSVADFFHRANGKETATHSQSDPSILEKSLPPTPSLPAFSLTKVFLAPYDDPTATKRVSVHYFTLNDFMLALPIIQEGEDEGEELENTDLQYAAENVISLLSNIASVARELALRSVSESPPSATKILQTQDQYLMSTSQYSFGSPKFSSKSGHLFNAKAILDNDPRISEVFSRGQNPQHWHVGRRGLGGINPSLGLTGNGDEVFMEVQRKEASLTDVDNVLTGAVKKSGLIETGHRS